MDQNGLCLFSCRATPQPSRDASQSNSSKARAALHRGLHHVDDQTTPNHSIRSQDTAVQVKELTAHADIGSISAW